MPEASKSEQLIELVGRLGVLRPRDLAAHAIPRVYLGRLVKAGLIQRIGRGRYCPTGVDLGDMHGVVEAAERVPSGVICLLSALRFHDLTTQNPFQVWVAIDVDASAPRCDGVPLRIVRFSGPALSSFIELHTLHGTPIRVYSPAKTVADCFKFRNKIGLDVAIEALRDCLRQRKATKDEIWAAARVCRVTSIIRPYLEAVS
jgi:predicted transcriptional regulator of viral defense system